jgi:MoaA/NifB/PqqE/SkfB family radical SAM enzyme
MAGAIAGTAILKNLSLSKKLKTITLTINNNCNLTCSHCYLQYEKKNFLVEGNTIDSIFNANFEHLAIVGKEPFVNKASISLLEDLIERCYLKNKTVSVITNGIGLANLKPEVVNYLDYIDVSFDGGPETYHLYRKGSFNKIITAIHNIQSQSDVTFNALNTISTGTIDNIDDMMAIKQFANFKIIMFSPYLQTKHDGVNNVSFVQLSDILKRLSDSKPFMDASESLLLLDTYHTEQEGVSNKTLDELIASYGLSSKIKLIEKDPLNYGIIRVTYDDLVLTPYESIHPKNYKQSHFLASNTNLNEVFEEMQNTF